MQVLQSQNAGAPKPTDDDQKTKFKQMDNDGAQLYMHMIRGPPRCLSLCCNDLHPTAAWRQLPSVPCRTSTGDGFIDAKDLRSFLGPAANVDKLIKQVRTAGS